VVSMEGYGARWPMRLRDLCRELRSPEDTLARQQVRREIWTILSHALLRFIEARRSSCADLTPEDIEDLASEKSLDLFRRLESGSWEIGDRTGSEIAGFLAATARNVVIDLIRSRGRQRHSAEEDLEALTGTSGEDLPRWDPPDTSLERGEFVSALRQCAEGLQPRVRRIWFFRVFYGLATKEIAAHPEVGLKPARVDELLFDVRQAIGRCMESKGQRLKQLPTGTFFEIWRSFHRFQLEEVGLNGQAIDASF
jgi:RNA polymerase sigma factor (sigma-70 family)